MKTVTRYQAFDGREFVDADECRKYELVSEQALLAVKPLGEKPELPYCGFEDGEGFVQHAREVVDQAKHDLAVVARLVFGDKYVDQFVANGMNVRKGILGRMISESGYHSLREAWGRIECIDEQFREWGQIFYALHPDEGRELRLN